jgi:hypothetical protein
VATVGNLTSEETIAYLRQIPELANEAVHCELADVDEFALKASGKKGRFFDQAVAAWLYDQGYGVLRYGSRLGPASFIASLVLLPL